MISAAHASLSQNANLYEPHKKKNLHWHGLRRLPKWKTLTKSDQRFLKAFYPKRFCCQSFTQLSQLFGISSRKNTCKQMQNYVDRGWITKEKRYIKNRKTKQATGVHLKNYYPITLKGKNHLKELLNELFDSQKQTTGVTLIRLSKLSKYKPGGSCGTPANFSPDRLKFSLLSGSKEVNSFLRVARSLALEHYLPLFCFDKTKRKPLSYRMLSSKDSEKPDSFKNGEYFREIQKIFNSYGFNEYLGTAYRGTLLKLLTYSLDRIEKLLALMRHKLSKKWRLRSFWAFFMKEIENERRFAAPWFKKLAGEYRDAADGKNNRITKGVDTNIVAQSIAKLERETGEKITETCLERMVATRTQKLKAVLDAICYRHSLGRGELPTENIPEEEVEVPQGRPIYKMVKVNSKTKKLYTEEDRVNGAPFGFANVITGYEPLSKESPPSQTRKKKKVSRIRSWVGLSFYALKLPTVESINEAFFKKREAAT